LQSVPFGGKFVAATSPGFLKEHAKPSAMTRKRAKDLIHARSLKDHNTDEFVHDLKDEDRCNTLANYFGVANTIEEGGCHLNGYHLDRRLRRKTTTWKTLKPT
jgi:hypothetical protein